jgi:hypothetical protein
MPITLTLKKTLEKNIFFKDLKNYFGYDACVVNVLDVSIDVSIVSENCRSMLQGEK